MGLEVLAVLYVIVVTLSNVRALQNALRHEITLRTYTSEAQTMNFI